MTLNQLEYFQKVATLQHFRQAAELLKISQPSLSRSMSLLEEELGLMLFEHQGRNVVLTKSAASSWNMSTGSSRRYILPSIR